MSGVGSRLAAVKALLPVFSQQASLATSLPAVQKNLTSQDAALTQALAFGVCRFYWRLNFYSQQLLKKAFKNKDQDLHLLLLVGLYQLEEGKIAPHAAINTCVEASKKLKKAWASKLLNACLRNFQRQLPELQQQLAQSNNLEAIHNHPYWLIKKLQTAYPNNWQEVCAANNQQAPFTLRINQRLTSQADYLAELEAAAIAASPCRYSSVGIQLETSQHPSGLPKFAEGFFSVQDEAAQLVVPLLLPENQAASQQPLTVLDACSAPGGKTAHLLETADLDLLALDIDAQRLTRVEENLARLKLTAQVKAADASDLASWWQGETYDRILLDAPCSATGVIRRHPDIKHLRRAEDLTQLTATQAQLLANLWPLLAEDGLLLYATCSLLPEENYQQIESFLESTPKAELVEITSDWGQKMSVGKQLLPDPTGADGFYYCLLKKIAVN